LTWQTPASPTDSTLTTPAFQEGMLPNRPDAAGGNFLCRTTPVMTGHDRSVTFSIIVFATNVAIRDLLQNNSVHSMRSSGTERCDSSTEQLLAMELPYPFMIPVRLRSRRSNLSVVTIRIRNDKFHTQFEALSLFIQMY
jgi:hypothetical protein